MRNTIYDYHKFDDSPSDAESPFHPTTVICRGCKAASRTIELAVEGLKLTGKHFRYCPFCGSGDIVLSENAYYTAVEMLASTLNIPPRVAKLVYDNWQPNEDKLLAFAATMLEEAGIPYAKGSV